MIAVILVGTQASGNIGACARVMMNMGCRDLRLVNPTASHLNRECLDRAMAAAPIAKEAKVFLTVAEAVADCHWVVGTSGKARSNKLDVYHPRSFAQKTSQFPPDKKIALVLGPEDRGLSNEDLMACEAVIEIPTSPELPSLNLSHALLVILYEAYLNTAEKLPDIQNREPPATVDHKAQMYEQLKEVLIEINYLDAANPDRIFSKIRTILSRADLDEYEVGLLRGLARQIRNRKT